ncbi:hypothetical protein F1643_14160 [Azospirillum sp. INR13]|uniref:hypothetical protein n=1 Tax=Azospirillum sp. INR13 TaxID=2596919 RepID=UPI00189249A8|nr:hypothetical protein [Azospirillum sp. INR13]MBF5095407.1 hypothetical protein [Azospirillum sp. INR13]
MADADRASGEAAEATAAVGRATEAWEAARLAVEEAAARHGESRRRFEAACAEQAKANRILNARRPGRADHGADERARNCRGDGKGGGTAKRHGAEGGAGHRHHPVGGTQRCRALEVWLRDQSIFAVVANQWERWDRLLERAIADGRAWEAAARERQRMERELASTEAAAEGVEIRLAEARERCRMAEQRLESLRSEPAPSLDEARQARAGRPATDGLLALLTTGEARQRLTTERDTAEREHLQRLGEAGRDGTAARSLPKAGLGSARQSRKRNGPCNGCCWPSVRMWKACGRLAEGEACPSADRSTIPGQAPP